MEQRLGVRRAFGGCDSDLVKTGELTSCSRLPRNNYPLAKKLFWIGRSRLGAVSHKTQLKRYLDGFGQAVAKEEVSEAKGV